MLPTISLNTQNKRAYTYDGFTPNQPPRFQNGCWHRGLPNDSPHPRTIVYFQYSPSMVHPLHRDPPNPSALSGYPEEERWLLHEPKGAESTVYGTAADKMRMDRFRRSDACEDADYYERRLKEAGQ